MGKKPMPSVGDKAVSNAFDGNDLNRRIVFEVSAQFGNVDIEVAAVEKGIAAPQKGENFTSFHNLVSVVTLEIQQFTFALR